VNLHGESQELPLHTNTSILGQTPGQTPGAIGFRNVSISQLRPMVEQPRKTFQESTLDELAQSIQCHGILQPLLVSPSLDGTFLIIAGERRYRAARKAGLLEVPVIVREASKHLQLEMALVENIQREELNPIEEAFAIQRLMSEHQYSQESLAERLGKDRTTLSNSIRLLSLPLELQKDLRERRISAGHGRALCGLDSKKLQLKIRDAIVTKKLSVRQTEELIKSFKRAKDTPKVVKDSISPDLRHLCEELKTQLQLKVRISGDPEHGKLEIEYFSGDDLEKLANLLLGNKLV
jgi:ParB family transcriptional regulator, chromosome partitioning protein